MTDFLNNFFFWFLSSASIYIKFLTFFLILWNFLCVLFSFSALKTSISKAVISIASFLASLVSLFTVILIFLLIIYSEKQLWFGGFVTSFTILKIFGNSICWDVGLDQLSFWFIFLTVFVFNSVFGYLIYSTMESKNFFIALLFLTEFLLINAFLVKNIFFFYFFFEGVLFPMFLIIGLFGTREARIFAAYRLFYYTLFAAFCFLASIIYIFVIYGATDYLELSKISFKYGFIESALLWLGFFITFAAKTPLLPVHIWLPDAHGEAPTPGSVLLAGVILKLGGYGIIRFLLPTFPLMSLYFYPFVVALVLVSMFYASYSAIYQLDFKKIVAYSSVVHMSFAVLALFNFSSSSLFSGIVLMIAHGFVSSGLFFSVGFLYDRFRVRDMQCLGVVYHLMPYFTKCFALLILANMAIPLSITFIFEGSYFGSLVDKMGLFIVIFFFPFIANLIFSLWLGLRLFFGKYNDKLIMSGNSDIAHNEFLVLMSLIIPAYLFGFFPMLLLVPLHIWTDYFSMFLLFRVAGV